MDVAVVPSAIATIVDNSDVKRTGDQELAAAVAAAEAAAAAVAATNGPTDIKVVTTNESKVRESKDGDDDKEDGKGAAAAKLVVGDAMISKAIAARDAFQQQLATLRAIGLVRQSDKDTQQAALKGTTSSISFHFDPLFIPNAGLYCI
jgi:hypothetical protein